MNMHGVFLHVLADALGSVVVIASALIVKFVPHEPDDTTHWTVYVDPTLSIIIIIIIASSAIPFFRDTTAILLQTIPKHLKFQLIQSELLEAVPEIDSIHELHIWRLTDEKIIVTAHLQRKDLSNYMSVAEKVKKFFHSIGIHSTTMQFECRDDRPTPLLIRANENSLKVTGDCLLRCDNDACDNHACCSVALARSNMLVNTKTNRTEQVATIRRPTLINTNTARTMQVATVRPPVIVNNNTGRTKQVVVVRRPKRNSGPFGTTDSSDV